MKKFLALCFVLILIFSFTCSSIAHADVLLADLWSAAAYSIAQANGYTFLFPQAAETYSAGVMDSLSDTYFRSKGYTISDIIGVDSIVKIGTALVVSKAAYDAICSFINWISGLTQIKYSPNSALVVGSQIIEGGNYIWTSNGLSQNYARWSRLNPDNTVTNYSEYATSNLGLKLIEYSTSYAVRGRYIKGGQEYETGNFGTFSKVNNLVTIATDGVFDPPEVPLGKKWSGTVEDAPDTNLEDLLGSVFDDAGLNDLVVVGEVIDDPVPPQPTPIPVDPDTPLSNVPWEGLNDLIDTSTGTIGEGIKDQTDAITGAQEATTEAVESLTDTIEGALDLPTSEELPDFKFDLRELFPFCIPFDIYRLLSSFDAEPVAPHVQLPIVIQSIGFSYNLDLDFSAWNPVAQAMRTAELIVYGIALAWATGKVIKW